MKIKNGMIEEYNNYVELNSTDGYSKGVIDFAVRWAELMEKEKELNAKLVDKLSSQADTEGITGFMYDCARSALYHFWEYGNNLKELLGTKSCCMFTIK
jgi:hypothetical protein